MDYGGTSASQIFCLHCDYRNLVLSPFFDIQLNLTPHDLSIAKLEQDSDDLTLLSKDKFAENKKEANNKFQKLRNELELISVEDHVPFSKLNFEVSDINKDLISSQIYIPSPLNSKQPKIEGQKNEGSLVMEDVIYNNFREDFLNNIDNYYICSGCDKKQKITENDMRFIVRKSFLLESPEVLVFTFKRFKKSSDSMFSNFTKNSIKVVYGDKLNMTPYFIKRHLAEEYKYELEAIVCHNGNLHSGHYTAYAKHRLVDEVCWVYFSDQYWKKVDAKDALSNPSAFMLFYRRQH